MLSEQSRNGRPDRPRGRPGGGRGVSSLLLWYRPAR